jgi:hypothetical protein
MQEMTNRLEGLGFKVEKEYSRNLAGYEFQISKRDQQGQKYASVGFFEYPEHVTVNEKDKLQRLFLEKLVDNFYRDFPQFDRNGKTDYTSYSRFNRVCVDPPNTRRMNGCLEGIQKVIFNFPATIVYWTDGTKTVVKMQEDDTWDPEKGLAMAIVKKVYGNRGNYCNEIMRWLPKDEEGPVEGIDMDSLISLGLALGVFKEDKTENK